MNNVRVHRTSLDDGGEIAGYVYGDGPPLVLVHGAMADGDSEWGAMLPILSQHFTCFTPSTRGRGLSSPLVDPSRHGRVRDLAAFIESVGEPVRVAAVSGGCMPAFGVASASTAVTAMTAHEPVVVEAIDPDLLAFMNENLDRMEEAGRREDRQTAARLFLDVIANDEECAVLKGEPALLEEAAQYLPVDIEEFRETFDMQGPSPTATAVLEQIAVPVLLTVGASTRQPWFDDGARLAASCIPDLTVRNVTGVGHFAHVIQPERMAGEMLAFLAAA